ILALRRQGQRPLVGEVVNLELGCLPGNGPPIGWKHRAAALLIRELLDSMLLFIQLSAMTPIVLGSGPLAS
ncbi:hypothetical protein AVEN_74719-1, partial [Araneus ventricosus]